MMSDRPALRRLVLPLVLIAAGAAPQTALAQVPGEVPGLVVGPASQLAWIATAGASFYNVYRGTLADLVAGVPPRCHGYRIAATSFATPLTPAQGEAFVYLVTAESTAAGPQKEVL